MSDTFCPLPWNFVAVRNNGDFRICCQSNVSPSQGLVRDSSGQVMNAKAHSFEEVRNSEIHKRARLDMLAGRWPESCQRCREEEENNLISRRKYENEAWPITATEAAAATASDGSIKTSEQEVEYLDVRFGNKCNLACRMCGPTDSNFWYRDHVALTGQSHFHDSHGRVELEEVKANQWKDSKDDYAWYMQDNFWNNLADSGDKIRHIYLAGGEPLLIDQHYKFLEDCIEKGLSQKIVIEYNTNGTVVPERAIELWKQFKTVRLGVSIDGVGNHFEYQRYPAKWKSVERNLRRLNDLKADNFNIWLACTVTVYNVFHIPDFIEWKLNSGLDKINRRSSKPILTHHMAHRPWHVNVRVLPEEVKKQVMSYYQKYLNDLEPRVDEKYFLAANKILNSISKYMNAESLYDEHWPTFVEKTKRLDEIRNQDYKTIFPDNFRLS